MRRTSCFLFCSNTGAGVLSLLPLHQRTTTFRRIAPCALESTSRKGDLSASLLNDTTAFSYGPSDNDPDFAAFVYDNRRYAFMEPLLQWAVNSGVEFAHGTEIVADEHGDWGVELVESKGAGTPILTIPQELILTTQYLQGTQLQRWMNENMEDDTNLPEFILTVILLEELSKDGASPWNSWLQSLPTEFSTGLFLDSFERSLIQRIAPKPLEQYEKQWSDCSSIITKLAHDSQSILNPHFRWWLQAQNDLLVIARWAFSVVSTRSWRTADGKHATLVPIGDMLNHDCRRANIRPCFREGDGALQLCLTTDIQSTYERPQGIYVSYGMSHQPSRFLVNFGFCDTSAPLIDACIDYYLTNNRLPPVSDEKNWPAFDPSDLVVSREHGVPTDGVWIMFLLNVLRRRDPSQIPRVQDAYDNDDDEELRQILGGLLGDWELPVALEMKDHFSDLLTNVYPDFHYSENDFMQHPRLEMITKYNSMMRVVYHRAIEHLNLVVEQSSKELAKSRRAGS